MTDVPYARPVELVAGLVLLGAIGAVITGLARFALPGPDPMPLWLMSLVGAACFLVGGSVGYAIGEAVGAIVVSVLLATVVLIGYRRIVQKRGLTGPSAHRLPTRGIGIRAMRRKWGVETESVDRDSVMRELERLGDLRDRGVLTTDEFEAKKAELLSRL